MADIHVLIEFDPSQGNQGKALRELQERFPDFPPSRDRPWWHKPPANARALVARVLSRHGCRGRLSLEPHDGVSAWDQAPPPRWTGFSPSTK